MLKTILIIAGMIIAIDIFCFILWVLSGQKPMGDFYLGTITGHFINLFI